MENASRDIQRQWAATPVKRRAKVFREVRFLIRDQAVPLAESCAAVRGCPRLEALTSEVLPLCEAAAWLEKKAPRVLADRKAGPSRAPIWLSGLHAVVRREARGRILIIGAGNYPLFLAGSQTIQALMAGNAVLLKPAPGATTPLRLLTTILEEGGVPAGLVTILPEDTAAVQEALAEGVDHVVFTGSATTGRQVLTACAESLTPATMELSGMDAFVILPDANEALVMAALKYGLHLNHGQTCVAPRRIFLPVRRGEEFRQRFRGLPVYSYSSETPPALRTLLQPLQKKAVTGEIGEDGSILSAPVILGGVPDDHELVRQEQFAPLATVHAYGSLDEVIELCRRSRWGLGASVFGENLEQARRVASALNAGVATVNDLIVPTADPRLPFGGRGESGFGVTRGPEGLLEMTRVSVTIHRKGNRIPIHLKDASKGDEEVVLALLGMAHGRTTAVRFRSLKQLIQSAPRNPRS